MISHTNNLAPDYENVYMFESVTEAVAHARKRCKLSSNEELRRLGGASSGWFSIPGNERITYREATNENNIERMRSSGWSAMSGLAVAAHEAVRDPVKRWDTSGNIRSISVDRALAGEPFIRTRIRRRTKPVLSLPVFISPSCSIAGSDIAKKCLLIMGAIDAAESQGYEVELQIAVEGQMYYVKGADQKQTRIQVTVKRPGEYVDPSEIALAISTGFVRGVIFSIMMVEGKKEIEVGLCIVNSPGAPGDINIMAITEESLRRHIEGQQIQAA